MDVLSTPDAQVDAGSDGTVVPDAGVACLSPDAGLDALGGIGVPAGTVVTASGSYSTQTPEGVITGTGWNAGAFSGWIELTFAAPVTLNGIQLVAGASPTATETYTLTGFQGGTPVSLGSWTDTVEGNCQCSVLLPPMLFAAGSYDAIQVNVNGGASWVAINQISLLTSVCPGSGDAGTPVDAGAPDAPIDTGAADSALSDVNAPTDAADAGVVTDAQNVDSGVPSCLVPGTYAIPVTGTNCSIGGIDGFTISGGEECTQEINPTSFDLALTIVDDPVAGWGVTFAQNTALILPPMTPLPIVLTATGFTVNGLVTGFSAPNQEMISLSVDCLTGSATFSGTYSFSDVSECVDLCGAFYVTYNSVSGTCSNCL
jgi:hypothetical protein